MTSLHCSLLLPIPLLPRERLVVQSWGGWYFVSCMISCPALHRKWQFWRCLTGIHHWFAKPILVWQIGRHFQTLKYPICYQVTSPVCWWSSHWLKVTFFPESQNICGSVSIVDNPRENRLYLDLPFSADLSSLLIAVATWLQRTTSRYRLSVRSLVKTCTK